MSFEFTEPIHVSEIPKLLEVLDKDITVFFIGVPGIGKSTQVLEFAKKEARELNRQFIHFWDIKGDLNLLRKIFEEPENYYVFVDLRLSKVMPEDLMGHPERLVVRYRDRRANVERKFKAMTYAPPIWAQILSLDGIAGLLFLDEFNQVQRDEVISASYPIVYDRSVGFVRLSPEVRVVCAGNPPEYSSISRLLPTPLISRFLVVPVVPPSIDDWKMWMDETYGDKWCSITYAFLSRFPDYFIKIPQTPEANENYPCPRNWTRLSLALNKAERLGDRFIVEKFVKICAYGLLGRFVGSQFVAFYMKRVPTPEELLEKPQIFSRLDLDSQYVMIWSLAQYTNKVLKEHRLTIPQILAPRLAKTLSYIADVRLEFLALYIKLLDKKSGVRATMVDFVSKYCSSQFQKLTNTLSKFL